MLGPTQNLPLSKMHYYKVITCLVQGQVRGLRCAAAREWAGCKRGPGAPAQYGSTPLVAMPEPLRDYPQTLCGCSQASHSSSAATTAVSLFSFSEDELAYIG